MSFASINPNILAVKYIENGDRGIFDTVAAIRKQISVAKHEVRIQDLVKRLTFGLKTQVEKSRALTQWFAENIRYVNDTAVSMTEQGPQFVDIHQCPAYFQRCEEMELLYKPEAVLFHVRAGDCDDFVMALGTMHELAGMRIQIVIIASDARNPREFSHVYFRALLDGQWVPIDPVNRTRPWGWEYERPMRRETFNNV